MSIGVLGAKCINWCAVKLNDDQGIRQVFSLLPLCQMSEIIAAISLQSKRDAVFQLCRRPSYPFHTQTLSCVLLVSVCLCVLVVPSQKEDLIATVMAGKIIPAHLL